jgi:hypothetical protein
MSAHRPLHSDETINAETAVAIKTRLTATWGITRLPRLFAITEVETTRTTIAPAAPVHNQIGRRFVGQSSPISQKSRNGGLGRAETNQLSAGFVFSAL